MTRLNDLILCQNAPHARILLHLVWEIADTLNGLMAFPNLIAVLGSLPLLLRLQKEFFAKGRT
jgi:Na+/alanine symporter